MGKKAIDYFYMILMAVVAIMLVPGFIAWEMNLAGRSIFLFLIGAILTAVAAIGSRSLKKLDNKQSQEKKIDSRF